MFRSTAFHALPVKSLCETISYGHADPILLLYTLTCSEGSSSLRQEPRNLGNLSRVLYFHSAATVNLSFEASQLQDSLHTVVFVPPQLHTFPSQWTRVLAKTMTPLKSAGLLAILSICLVLLPLGTEAGECRQGQASATKHCKPPHMHICNVEDLPRMRAYPNPATDYKQEAQDA